MTERNQLTISKTSCHVRFEQRDSSPSRLKITTLDVRRVLSQDRNETQIEIAIERTKNNRTYTECSSFCIPYEQLDMFVKALTHVQA